MTGKSTEWRVIKKKKKKNILIYLTSTVPFCLIFCIVLCWVVFSLFSLVLSCHVGSCRVVNPYPKHNPKSNPDPKLRYETRHQKALLPKNPWKCVNRRSVLILCWCGLVVLCLVVSCRLIVVRLSCWRVWPLFGPVYRAPKKIFLPILSSALLLPFFL
jgi:hypothetical protein